MLINNTFRARAFSIFLFFVCLLIELSLSANTSNSKTWNSEILNHTKNTTESMSRVPFPPVTRTVLTKTFEDKILSTSRPSEVHSLFFYKYYHEYQFIVKAPFRDGIIMVVQDLFMDNGNESVSNRSCANFIQVTQANTTFPKICGEVKAGDNSSAPSGLIGPRSLIFTGKQIIVNIKQHHFVRRKITGQLIFTEFMGQSRCRRSRYSSMSTKSCPIAPTTRNRIQSLTFERQICISSTLFCNDYYNCGNVSGDDSFGYDESLCNNLVRNANRSFTRSGSGTGSRHGGGSIPILFPIVHQPSAYNPRPSNTFSYNSPGNALYKPSNTFSSYDSPSNTLYKPGNTFSSYNYNSAPKYSPGFSSSSTKTITKSSGKGFKWLFGGALAILGGLGSLFGCKKKSEQEQSESNITQTEQIRQPNIEQNEQELRILFPSRPEDVAPPKYETENNVLVDESPPTYQESTRIEAGFRDPPPYKYC